VTIASRPSVRRDGAESAADLGLKSMTPIAADWHDGQITLFRAITLFNALALFTAPLLLLLVGCLGKNLGYGEPGKQYQKKQTNHFAHYRSPWVFSIILVSASNDCRSNYKS
jgi:hypothetical protein